MLHRLVGGAILTVAHGVVREYEDGRQLHQRRKPDGGPRVVAEDEERCPEYAKLRERQTVDDRRHRMLADSKMQVLAVRRLGLKVSRALVGQRGLVRWSQVRRPAEEPRDVLREHVEYFARRIPAGDALGIRREHREVAIPTYRQVPRLHLIDLFRELGILLAVRRHERGPPASRGGAACPDAGREALAHAVGDQELRVLRPPIAALAKANFLRTELLAVRGRGVLLVRGAVADVAVEDDQRGAPLRFAKDAESGLDAIEIVGVADTEDVPAVPLESGGDILCEYEARLTFDRDVVVVVDPAEVVEREMTGERRRFGRHALHQTAVAADDVHVVVENGEPRPVVMVGEPFLSDGHSPAGRGALAQRPRRGFYAGHPVILRVSRRLAADLPEAADVLQRHRRLPQSLVLGIDRSSAG